MFYPQSPVFPLPSLLFIYFSEVGVGGLGMRVFTAVSQTMAGNMRTRRVAQLAGRIRGKKV